MISLYQSKTIEELKQLCREKCIKGYSKLTKQKLIDLLLDTSSSQIIDIETNDVSPPPPPKLDITFKPETKTFSNPSLPYLNELTETVPKDKKRIVCKLCNELGHNEKSIDCRENQHINKKIIDYVFNHDTYDIKELSSLYNKTQIYIQEVIKTISKREIIEYKQIHKADILELIQTNIAPCEMCSTERYHTQNNRIWKGQNICDFCWALFEDEREKLWERISSLIDNHCKICNKQRTNTKIRFHYDHINMFDKCDSICSMVNNGCEFEDIQKEVMKCQYVCVSCHAIITEIEQKLGFTGYKTTLVKKLNNEEISLEEYNQEMKRMFDIYQRKMNEVYILCKEALKQ